MRKTGWLVAVAFSVAALAEEPKPAQQPSPEDAAQIQMLNESANLLQQNHVAEAMVIIDKMNAKADEKIRAEKRKVYTTRTMAEALLYSLQAANDKVPEGSVGYHFVWSQGYFLKGYILNGSGQLAAAEPWLRKALAMAPMNSQYLLEMGNLLARQKNWPAALEDYHKAEEASRAFAPDAQKNADLGKAWRGSGFVLVEEGKLDDAEKMYQQCLDLDPRDQRAANELKYVRAQKEKAGGTAKP